MNLVSTGKTSPDQPSPTNPSGHRATSSRRDRPARGPSSTVLPFPSTSLTSQVSATAQSGSPSRPRWRAMAWPPNTSCRAGALTLSGYQSTAAPVTGPVCRR